MTDDSNSDAQGSDEDAEGEDDYSANPFPLEGIYKDAADRERCVERKGADTPIDAIALL